MSWFEYRKTLDKSQVKSQGSKGFEALTHGGIRASSHPPVSVTHQRSKSMESFENWVKCFHNFFDIGAHSPMPR